MRKNKSGKGKLTAKSKTIIFSLIFLFVLIIGGFYFYPLIKLKDIENSYSNIVLTTKQTNIYKVSNSKTNENYEKIGIIKKNIPLELESKTDNGYFNIKGTNYYINYKDIKKSKLKKQENNNYLDFNKNIEAKNKIDLYKNGNLALTINDNINLPVKYMDDKYYYVYYGGIFGIKKEEVTLIDNINNDNNESSYISVLYYNKIDNNCSDKKCISIDTFKEQLNYLKENGYYTIDMETYKKWLKGYVRLKEKAILLTGEETNDIVDDYGFIINKIDNSITYKDTNRKTTKENNIENIDRYVITSSINLDKFKDIVNGKYVYNSDLLDPNDLATEIGVVNYHFFYDSSIGEGCNEEICLDTKNFEEQLKYLKDNNYKTLTIEEFRAWMYGEIELPKKSVLLTIDDGAMGTGSHNGNKLIPLLEKYDMYGTLFLITGWWDINNYKSPNLDVQSHTNNMHTAGLCSAFRGAQILCSTNEQVIADLKKSIEITGSDTSFCFPFYAYDDNAIELVKQVGFKMSFVGGNKKATRDDKYRIPRYPIYKSTTLDEFINMIS